MSFIKFHESLKKYRTRIRLGDRSPVSIRRIIQDVKVVARWERLFREKRAVVHLPITGTGGITAELLGVPAARRMGTPKSVKVMSGKIRKKDQVGRSAK